MVTKHVIDTMRGRNGKPGSQETVETSEDLSLEGRIVATKSSVVPKDVVGGLSIKAVVLVSVTMQNALYTLLRRYSQGVLKETVSSAEVLLLSELFKLTVSAYVTTSSADPSDAVGRGSQKLLWLAANSSKMLVLALIYAAMNVLSFVALRRIDAAAFTVCAQLKILTTAFFAVVVLQRHLTWTKWRALMLIVCASVLVSTPAISGDSFRSKADCGDSDQAAHLAVEPEEEEAEEGGYYDTAVGFGAVLAEVILSGFASIYFEKVIKATNVKLSIWDRNFQLALYSILFYASMIVYDNATTGREIGGGWSVLSLLVSVLGALGGILVALSVKHTDSIMKSIAVSGAIVLASAGGYAFLGGPMTLPMALGSVVAIIATQNYTFDHETPEPALLLPANVLAASSGVHRHWSR